MLPWSDQPPASETNCILEELLGLNERHVWTINSQPRVDGARSDDATFGWGPSNGGYIYQKAYLEFFLPTHRVGSLLRLLAEPHYKQRINFHIVNACGTRATACLVLTTRAGRGGDFWPNIPPFILYSYSYYRGCNSL